MTSPDPAVLIVELGGIEPEADLDRIRRACDPERPVRIVAAARDPAVIQPASRPFADRGPGGSTDRFVYARLRSFA